MRKSLLVAASLFAAATSAATFEVAKASPQFKVTAGSPGAVEFTGSGTAQFNNSIGTNNSFQVGSSTNLGVNASASSTPEYGVTGIARLDLAGTTSMKQVIGTSGAHQDTTNKASAAYTVAHQAASDRAHEVGRSAQSSWEVTSESSWDAYRDREVTAGRATEKTKDVTNDDGSTSQVKTGEIEFTATASDQFGTERAWSASRESSYDSAYENKYSTEYASEWTRSLNSLQSTSSGNTDTGTIKGTFKTEEYGSAQSAGSESEWTLGAKTNAKETADAEWGATFVAYQASAAGLAAGAITEEAEWSREYNNSYNNEYSRSYATAAAGAARSSDSSVEVNGIGSDATIAAGSTSTFDVEIKEATLPSSFSLGSTATANGSAGANLATSSFANQSQSSTASGFLQAFGGEDGGFVSSGSPTTGTYSSEVVTTLTPD